MRKRSSKFSITLATKIALMILVAPLPFRHPSLLTATAQRTAIDTYAISHARIVTVSGATIERGTVVIRDGLIVAVGPNVTAPADARVIDGTGLTVYPGLIDAHTTLGIPRPAAPTPTPGAGAENPFAALTQAVAPPSAASPNSSQPPGLQPEILAADIIRPGGEQIEAARNAGLTAALTTPRGYIFLGQSAFINLSGATPQQMLVRSPVALHIGFTPLGGGSFGGAYPGSLMGVFSSIRQMLLDARRYREANQIYESRPRGLKRPEQDKSLAALVPALTRAMPVVMQADREREIIRALDLAQEFNLRVIIAGGADAWKVADRLRAADVPVLLSLNFPRRMTVAAPEADPEPLRLLRERVEAPKTAARLTAAGVRFAFQSGSLTNMSDYLANAAKTVENGLASDEAIRAMTIRPAEILGIANQVGTIEVGKIANLTITRGDLLARDRRIVHVFIDGRPIELKTATATSTSAVNASGTWTLRVNTASIGQGEASVTLLLEQQGERLTGSMQGPLGSGQIANGSVGAGGEIRFTVPIQTGGETVEANFRGTITGHEMRGAVEIIGRGSGSFSGSRPGAAPIP